LGKILAERSAKVAYAMRYGEPSIQTGLAQLAGCRPLVVPPLYPQYSPRTAERVRDVIGAKIAMIEDFHDHPAYIAAVAAGVQRHWAAKGKSDKLVMSFCALPRRAVDKGDPYQTQCLATSKILAGVLRIAPGDYVV